jgi:hypothetical protein
MKASYAALCGKTRPDPEVSFRTFSAILALREITAADGLRQDGHNLRRAWQRACGGLLPTDGEIGRLFEKACVSLPILPIAFQSFIVQNESCRSILERQMTLKLHPASNMRIAPHMSSTTG